MLKVAVIGIQGVPAHYGGFESLVENLLGKNCPPEIQYTVFCSSQDYKDKKKFYKGARLKYIPVHANGIHSIPYDILSMCLALRGFDSILILGVSGGVFMPMLRQLSSAKIIVNIDGLEHKREKWGKTARWYLKNSESLAVKFADVIVADNKGIQNYVKKTYKKETVLIPYGGDQVVRNLSEKRKKEILNSFNLKENDYAITVCRIEPENNPEIILNAFAHSGQRLLFIGNWHHSDWSQHLMEKFSRYPNIRMQNSIYDLDILAALREKAHLYIHGHSAGGTNPSLVEAMHFGIPIATWDVVYNRETTEGKAYYFKTAEELMGIFKRNDLDGSQMKEIAMRRYLWKIVAKQYCDLFLEPRVK